MKITFKAPVFEKLFEIAVSQGKSPAALIEKITTEYVNEYINTTHKKRENGTEERN